MKDLSCKLTPLGVMVLALLREGDMHPYEMIRLMRQRHDDRLVSLTNGTVYHTVARLERLGLLAEVGVDREGNRPERTTYTVTDAGCEVVIDWVRQELPRIDRPVEFRVALAEAHNLDREETVDLLIARRAALIGEYRVHRDGLTAARSRSVAEQFLIEIDRQAVLLHAELAWMDDAIAQLESRAYAWGPAELDPPHTDTSLAQRKAAQP